jgi:hypothetical protein
MKTQIENLDDLFEKMWKDYVETNPPAQRIYDLLESEGEKIINDHIAFRTFNNSLVNIDVLAKTFLEHGYEEKDHYTFEEKKLYAKHYEHDHPLYPKIFISELKLELFDDDLNRAVHELVSQIPPSLPHRIDFTTMGRPWDVSYDTYQMLKEKSEYAAWVAAFGFRPNHFTVSVDHLNKFNEIQDLNKYLKNNGFKMNESGGEVKGSPDLFLEQSSTLAYNVDVEFQDGIYTIPACYYEFAKRYNLPNGKLFTGFVAKSADKIFESTDKGQ